MRQPWGLERCEQTIVRKAQVVGALAVRGDRSVVTTEDDVIVETYVADRGYLLDSLGEVYILGTRL